MPADPFHLAWFLQGSSIQAWGEPWTGTITDDWMSCDMFLDLARGCERACMDYMLLEDSIYVGETWQNSRDMYLKNGMSIPRQEPTIVATLMAAATTRLGIVPTLSTFAYAPYLDGAHRRHAGPDLGRTRRLEHGDRQLRSVGEELRHGAPAAA